MRMGYWHYETGSYYRNFVDYVLGSKSVEEYRSYFDKRVNRSYAVGEWIKSRTEAEDRMFVWGDETQIYLIAERLPITKYLASYHVREFGAEEETLNQLRKSKPVAVVIMDEAGEWEELEEWVEDMYELKEVVDGGRIYILNF